mmetsp:Transcript_23741/g.30263  ORF Transcript_23741/g.30263 Transcript_23741/m.30263 type:complete len:139 (-) Transcript_23741:1004-1420(-)
MYKVVPKGVFLISCICTQRIEYTFFTLYEKLNLSSCCSNESAQQFYQSLFYRKKVMLKQESSEPIADILDTFTGLKTYVDQYIIKSSIRSTPLITSSSPSTATAATSSASHITSASTTPSTFTTSTISTSSTSSTTST